MLICNSANSPAGSSDLKQSRPIDRARVKNRSIRQTGSEDLRLAKRATRPCPLLRVVCCGVYLKRLKKISSHPLRGYQISRHVLFFLCLYQTILLQEKHRSTVHKGCRKTWSSLS